MIIILIERLFAKKGWKENFRDCFFNGLKVVVNVGQDTLEKIPVMLKALLEPSISQVWVFPGSVHQFQNPRCSV